MDLRSHLQLPSVSSPALDQFTSAGSILLVSIKTTAASAVIAFSSSRTADIHIQNMTQVTIHHIIEMTCRLHIVSVKSSELPPPSLTVKLILHTHKT